MSLEELERVVTNKLNSLSISYVINYDLNRFTVLANEKEARFTRAFQFEIDIDNQINKLIKD